MKKAIVVSLCLIGVLVFAQVETTIAGITVGKSWDHVLKLYGQPNRILTSLQAGVAVTTTMPGMPGISGMAPGVGMPGMMPGMMRGSTPGAVPGMPGMMGPGAPGMPGAGVPASGMPGMMGPGMPGMMGPGMPGMMGSGMPGMMGSGMGPMPGMRMMGSPMGPQGGVFPLPSIGGVGGTAPQMQTQVEQAPPNKVVWVYDLPGGITLRVTMDIVDGRVVEVNVSGNKWAKATTRKGITLGDSYAKVLQAYGWPEEQTQSGDILFCRYDDKYHVVFGLRNKKVVSINITL